METLQYSPAGAENVAHNATTFGQHLRRERERRGVSLHALSSETKVNPRQLEALESDDYRELPGGVFRRGIVRAYLHALHLEEEDWMPRFQASHEAFLARSGAAPAEGPDAWVTFAMNVKRNRGAVKLHTGLRWAGLLLLLLLLVGAGWAVWAFLLRPRLA